MRNGRFELNKINTDSEKFTLQNDEVGVLVYCNVPDGVECRVVRSDGKYQFSTVSIRRKDGILVRVEKIFNFETNHYSKDFEITGKYYIGSEVELLLTSIKESLNFHFVNSNNRDKIDITIGLNDNNHIKIVEYSGCTFDVVASLKLPTIVREERYSVDMDSDAGRLIMEINQKIKEFFSGPSFSKRQISQVEFLQDNTTKLLTQTFIG